ncbi:MAG: hypothetical protein OXD45_14265 [Rhodobacteraceae bacterium]|nr:hypothetical protein [Paracoccaceae bacterium]
MKLLGASHIYYRRGAGTYVSVCILIDMPTGAGGLARTPRGGDGLCLCRSGERHYQQDGDQIKSGGGVIDNRFMCRFSLPDVSKCFAI